jgi:hypothetical protein
MSYRSLDRKRTCVSPSGVRVKGSDGNVITPGSDADEDEPDEDQPVPCAFCLLSFPDADGER